MGFKRERETRTTQISENLREKPAVGKSAKREREILLMQEDYNGCSKLYYRFNSLGFPLVQREGIGFYSRGTTS